MGIRIPEIKCVFNGRVGIWALIMVEGATFTLSKILTKALSAWKIKSLKKISPACIYKILTFNANG
jgi:hypothetical protein